MKSGHCLIPFKFQCVMCKTQEEQFHIAASGVRVKNSYNDTTRTIIIAR